MMAVPPRDPDPMMVYVPYRAEYKNIRMVFWPYICGGYEPGFRSAVVNLDGYGLRRTVGAHGEDLTLDTIGDRPCGLIFGGSNPFGDAASSDAYTYASLLSQRTDLPWLNMATASFTLNQGLMTLLFYRRKLKSVKKIALVAGLNDLGHFHMQHNYMPVFGGFYDLSKFFLTLNSSFINPQTRTLDPRFGHQFRRIHDYHADGRYLLEALATTFTNWRMLAADLGAELTFVFQPVSYWHNRRWSEEEQVLEAYKNVYWDWWPGHRDYLNAARSWYVSGLRQLCADNGIPFFDINEEYERRAPVTDGKFILVDHCHLTDLGHQITADMLIDMLKLNRR